MANEFVAKNGIIAKANSAITGTLDVSGNITMGTALVATRTWVTSTALSGYATESYVTTAIANLVDSAPGTLDTLNELAAALGDDPNFATTVTNSIAGKVSKSGDTMTGALNIDYSNAYLYIRSAVSGSGVQWHDQMWLGRYDNVQTQLQFPNYLPGAAYGLHVTKSSDAFFAGLISRGEEYNDFNAVIAWGDDAGGDVLQYRFNNGVVATLSETGSFNASNLTINSAQVATQSWVTSQGYLTTYENNYISDVRLTESTLSFTGEGSAFTGDIDLSGLPFQPAGSYLTAEADTLATVTARGSSTTSSITVNGSLLIGPSGTANAYSGAATGKLYFGSQDSDSPTHYHITTNMEDYNGNYSKLDIRWYTGQRFYAHTGYGGFRFHEITTAAELFSVGKGDAHVRVANNLYVSGGTTSGDITVSGSSAGIYFTGGNNRIYFAGARAIEGNGTNLQIGEGHSQTQIQSSTTRVDGILTTAGTSINTSNGARIFGLKSESGKYFTQNAFGQDGGYTWPSTTYVTGNDNSPVGNVTFRGNGAYQGHIGPEYIPIDATKTYKVSVWIRAVSGSPYCYLSHRQYYWDYSNGNPTNGGWGNPYWWSGTPSSSWTEYSMTIGPAGSGADHTHMPGVKFIRHGWLHNYTADGSATAEFQGWKIEELDSTLANNVTVMGNAVIHAGNIGSQSVSYATTSGNSVTTSQTNFAELFIEDAPVATKEYVTSQGYITGYTETDTLATVTGRGATTSSAITVNNRIEVSRNGSYGSYLDADLVVGTGAADRRGYGATGGSNIMLRSSAKSTITALDESQNLGQISYENLVWTIGENIGWGVQRVDFPGQIVGKYASSSAPDYANPLWLWAYPDTDAIVIQNTTAGGTPPKIYFRDTDGTIQTSNTLIRLRTSNSDSLSAYLSGGDWYATGSMRAPIFYDSNDTNYYLDPTSTETGLRISGGIVSTAGNGAVLLKHENSEANAWIFRENAANWGLFWFNAGGQSGQTIGSYTTVGAELFGMNNAVSGFNPNSGWSGTDASTRAAWMLSNYSGYLWTQGTQYSETDMRSPVFRLINSSNNAYITGNSEWGVTMANDNGYIQFGPANDSWSHIYSDKNFYFNQDLYVNGTRVVLNSGTWGINITGSAASATTATNLYGPAGSYIKMSTSGTSYQNNYQVRENDGGGNNTNEIYAPQLAFHWSGVVASSIMMEASGRIAIRNNPGTGYEAFIAGIIYSSGYGNSTQWNTAYSWGNHATAGYFKLEGTEPITIQAETVTFTGNVTVEGTFTESSSIRFKENIVDLESATEKVENLRPVRYNKIDSEVEEIGLIAEEVAEIYPEVVTYNEEGEPTGVNYTRLSVILLKSVQELSERINKLENK